MRDYKIVRLQNLLLIFGFSGFFLTLFLIRAPILYILVYHVIFLATFGYFFINFSHKGVILFVASYLTISYLIFWIVNDFFLRELSILLHIFGNILLAFFSLIFILSLKIFRKKYLIIGNTLMFVLFAAILTVAKFSPRISEPSTVDFLRTLGYVSSVRTDSTVEADGVTIHNRLLAYEGYNLYTSIDTRQCYLKDMSGNTSHSWVDQRSQLDFVREYDGGDLLGMTNKRHLVRFGFESERKWDQAVWCHHDIDVGESGLIYTLSWIDKLVVLRNFPVPVINDAVILELSPEGIVKRKISLFDLFRDRIPVKRVLKILVFPLFLRPYFPFQSLKNFFENETVLQYDTPFDILHANSLRIVERNVPGVCSKGNFLISVRELDTVAIVDADEMRILWEWGPGELQNQHNATLLSNGNILIFDNGTRRGYSRVIEVDPRSKEIVWEYRADPVKTFYSPRRGSAQRLPNGNTLITESDRGRVFEVAVDGEIVWEFFNPDRTSGGERLPIYQMRRVRDFGLLSEIETVTVDDRTAGWSKENRPTSSSG